jgi:hypothetical protein
MYNRGRKDSAVNKPTIALSLAAGLLGGMLSHYLTPTLVHAQAPAPAAAAVQTLKLPIVFVDEAGNPVGAVAMDSDGQPNIKLYGNGWTAKQGGPQQIIWTARQVLRTQPATGQ